MPSEVLQNVAIAAAPSVSAAQPIQVTNPNVAQAVAERAKESQSKPAKENAGKLKRMGKDRPIQYGPNARVEDPRTPSDVKKKASPRASEEEKEPPVPEVDAVA